MRQTLYTLIILSLSVIQLSAFDQVEFFESRIRPVLAENCYECHNSINKSKSGLVLDFKEGMVRGGDRGAVLSLKKAEESLLLKVMRHGINNLKMPKGGPKLPDSIIMDLKNGFLMVLMTQEKNRQLQKNLPKKPHGKRFARKENYGGVFNPFVRLKLPKQGMNIQWIIFLIQR